MNLLWDAQWVADQLYLFVSWINYTIVLWFYL